MNNSSSTLQQSHRTVLDTEGVAHGITEQLNSNHDTITGIHSKILETGGLLGQAGRTLRQMQRMETRKKIILSGVIILLILVMALIIYVATSAKASSTNSTTGNNNNNPG
jgi:hypothetical protein